MKNEKSELANKNRVGFYKFTLLLIATFFFITTSLFSQITDAEKKLRSSSADSITGWKNGGIFSLSLAQTSMVNWAAGGQNSVAINGLVSQFANYKGIKSSWDNNLDLGYGMLRQGKDASFIKTDDKVDFTSKYGQKAYKSWYYAGLLNFKTQMTPGYNYPNDSVKISDFLAPAYLLGALGMDYKYKDVLSVFIAPVTSKTTIVNSPTLSNMGAFGVDSGKVFRSEFGGYLRVQFKKDLMTNVTLTSKIDLFSNYLHNPQNIDVNFEALISMKVNKFITATIFANLVYDDDIIINWVDKNDVAHSGPTTQFKEVLGVGFSYKF